MQKSETGRGDLVLLTGFAPLMADALTRVLTARGFPMVVSVSEGDPPTASTVVAEVEPHSLPRLDAVARAWPGVPVVVVTSSASAALRQGARRIGACALVERSTGIEGVARAISAGLDGRQLDFDEPPRARALADLTERETSVLRLVAVGATNEAIGDALGISPHTARTHVQNLMAKLGVRNRLGAAAVAREAGLTSGTPS